MNKTYQEDLEDEVSALEKTTDALEKKKEALEKSKASTDDAINSIESLIDWTEKYIKQTKEDEKEALQERKASIDELIDKKQELLEKEKEEHEYNKQVNEYQNDIASKALTEAVTSLDDSSAGRKANKTANDELVDSRNTISEYLYGHEYDVRKETLDDLKTEMDKYYDDQIETIDKFLNDEVAIYRAACAMIDSDNGTLYGKLLYYCNNYTTTTQAEFTNMWNKAQSALEQYGGANIGVFDLMNSLQQRMIDVNGAIDTISGQIETYNSRIDTVKQKLNELSEAAQEAKRAIQEESEEEENAKKWHFYDSITKKTLSSNKAKREDAASEIASKLSKLRKSYVPPQSMYSDLVRYASGTKSAKQGLAVVDEQGLGSEIIGTPVGGGRYTLLAGGNPVFNKTASSTLYDFANQPEDFLKSMLANLTPNPINTVTTQQKTETIAPVLNIQIAGDATQSTINALVKEENRIANLAAKKIMTIATNNRNRI